jgi:hypothetical protein
MCTDDARIALQLRSLVKQGGELGASLVGADFPLEDPCDLDHLHERSRGLRRPQCAQSAFAGRNSPGVLTTRAGSGDARRATRLQPAIDSDRLVSHMRSPRRAGYLVGGCGARGSQAKAIAPTASSEAMVNSTAA